MRYLLLIGLALILLGGCAAHHAPTTTASSSMTHDECLVCKHNADLACVDIEVDQDTPSTVYEGKTYRFCSDECRNKFAKDPKKYAQR